MTEQGRAHENSEEENAAEHGAGFKCGLCTKYEQCNVVIILAIMVIRAPEHTNSNQGGGGHPFWGTTFPFPALSPVLI